MITRKEIAKILEIAVHAPSGENCQPWQFRAHDNQIDIFNVPERDMSLYNFRQRGSLIAHGALIENIYLTAPTFGYQAVVNILPNQNDQNHIATIIFKEATTQIDPLHSLIGKRHTNRKPYNRIILTDSQKEELKKSAKEIGFGEVRFVDDAEKKLKIAKALTVSDRMLFENKKVHDFLFSHISWTKKEIEKRKAGFYVKELELALPQEKAFKLFRNWGILRIFNALGFAKMAAKGNAKIYNASAAIGAVVTDSDNPRSFILGGRVMERLWLKATKMRLSIQPVTGVIFFAQRIFEEESKDFSRKHVCLIKGAYEKIIESFEVTDRTIIMLFRVGQGDSPSSYSRRNSPKIE